MKTFKPYTHDQLLLLPPALQDWLPEGHLASFIGDVVDHALDLTPILGHVEREMPPFLERHREEVKALGEEVRQDFLDRQFLGFFEKELWPIAEPRLRPVITHISKEIWDEVPLWGFSWRLAYQTLPFTANDHLQVAWKQFVDGHVVPILSSHTAEIVEAGRDIAREALARPEMAGHLRQSFQRVIESPRFQGLCPVFLREVILDSPTFHEAMERRGRSPEVRRAIEAATGQIEPARSGNRAGPGRRGDHPSLPGSRCHPQ